MNLRYPLIAVALLAALAGAYLLGRTNAPAPTASPSSETDAFAGASSAAKPRVPAVKLAPAAAKGTSLPTAGEPLRDTFAELQARADAGDAAAAARLLRDLNRCHRLRTSEWRNAASANELTGRKTQDMRPEQLRTYQMLLNAAELTQQRVRQDQVLCDGVGEEMLDALVENMAQAARLGDKEARACYLERGPLYDPRSLLSHPQSLSAYRQQVPAMIQSGLVAGDWRLVDLLRQAYEPGSSSLLAGLLGADPVQHYRYLRLYRLGAESHRIAGLDRQLAAAAANLTPEQVADADRWAQTTLQERFDGHSTAATPQGWEACAF